MTPTPTTPYSQRLHGKTAVVTGSGARGGGVGIGQGIAILFARQGAEVCVVDVDRSRAEITVQSIVDEGGTGAVVEANVTRRDDCMGIVEAAVEAFGRVNILVNNVGVAERKVQPSPGQRPPDPLEEDDWFRVIDINLKGAILMMEAASEEMAKVGGGAIVNIASIAGIDTTMGAYAVSKTGLLMETRARAVAYARDGIRVNAISPGAINTPMVAGAGLSKERLALQENLTPLGFRGEAWDVAWGAVFLASEEARYITGSQLVIDGGLSQVPPLSACHLAATPRRY